MSLFDKVREAEQKASASMELRRRIIRPRNRRRDTWDDWDDGLEPQGYWSEEN